MFSWLISIVLLSGFSGAAESFDVSELGRDLLGSTLPEGAYLCPNTSVDRTADVMTLVRNNDSRKAVNLITKANGCREVKSSPETALPIKRYYDLKMDKSEGSDYPTGFWFVFEVEDKQGNRIPAFIGIDTE